MQECMVQASHLTILSFELIRDYRKKLERPLIYMYVLCIICINRQNVESESNVQERSTGQMDEGH